MSANNDGSFNSILAAAQKKAQNRSVNMIVGPDWPNANDCELEDAARYFTIEMYEHELKLSIGLLTDGTGVYCRISYPKNADCEHAGMTAFTVASTCDRALRKAAQLYASDNPKVWRLDTFAK